MNQLNRRMLLGGLLGGASAVTFGLNHRSARAVGSGLKRVLFFYFPDGVSNGSGEFFPSGSVNLSEQLAPLESIKSRCDFIAGLSMGSADEGSHPGGAQKLLTCVPQGQGASIDQVLGNSVGSSDAFPVTVLGAGSTLGGTSSDKFISYSAPGNSVVPEDDPTRAFSRAFSSVVLPTAPSNPPPAQQNDARNEAMLDVLRADLESLQQRAGNVDEQKLNLHLEALREVEQRMEALSDPSGSGSGPIATTTDCDSAPGSLATVDPAQLADPAHFPRIVRAQTDVMVQMMACGLTRVGVLQNSYHTSELIMSRFEGAEQHNGAADMRSHQASHYGGTGSQLHTDFIKQRRWWMEQFSYAVQALAARPEENGTMLDYTAVVLCSEVSDGNNHSHSNMPFVVAGGGVAGLGSGRVIDGGGRRHGDLYTSLANALGDPMATFGEGSSGPLPGL